MARIVGGGGGNSSATRADIIIASWQRRLDGDCCCRCVDQRLLPLFRGGVIATRWEAHFVSMYVGSYVRKLVTSLSFHLDFHPSSSVVDVDVVRLCWWKSIMSLHVVSPFFAQRRISYRLYPLLNMYIPFSIYVVRPKYLHTP